MKLSKHEQKYRAKQQIANRFTQKSPLSWGYMFQQEKVDKSAVRKLVDKICK